MHRDVKPANVFVLSSGGAKLGDFGIARVLGDVAAFRSAVGTSIGTPTYMAPEQILGDRRVGPEADVYAFSVMAYEVTVGRLPFVADTIDAVFDAHLSRADDPNEFVAGYPRAGGRRAARRDGERSIRPSLGRHRRRRARLGADRAVAAAAAPTANAGNPGRPRSRGDDRATGMSPSPSSPQMPGTSRPGEQAPGASLQSHAATADATGWVKPPVFQPTPTTRP